MCWPETLIFELCYNITFQLITATSYCYTLTIILYVQYLDNAIIPNLSKIFSKLAQI